MSFRFIGSKARLTDLISNHIWKWSNQDGMFVDMFCGTGAVSETASKLGWPVWVNDHLVSAGIMASARLTNKNDVHFEKLGGYKSAIDFLNKLKPFEGFIYKEYSPASKDLVGIERKYFTKENAGRIDAIRLQIEEWEQNMLLTNIEKRLLIADLVSATNSIANIAGTYGCFLSKWEKKAHTQLKMVPRQLTQYKKNVKITSEDAATLQVKTNDLVYLDPPYTKRQYAAYYHILETIALYDDPIVEGVSGLRPWREKASDFCYRRKASEALFNLIDGLNARHILLSYSEEGHISIDEMMNILIEVGSVLPYSLGSIGRYRPNTAASKKNSSVNEYLFVIEKEVQSESKEAVI